MLKVCLLISLEAHRMTINREASDLAAFCALALFVGAILLVLP